MPDWPAQSIIYPSWIGMINSWSWESGSYGAWPAGYDVPGNIAPTANLITYIPFIIDEFTTIYDLVWYNGTAVSGNVDMGIFSEDGDKLVSSGSTTQAVTSDLQVVSITPMVLDSGSYYMGIDIDNSTGRLFGIQTIAHALELLGIKQQTATFPLPSTATFGAPATSFYPWIGLTTTPNF